MNFIVLCAHATGLCLSYLHQATDTAQQSCEPVLSACVWFLQLIIDPVCMLTCCPKLLHSFVYKVPEVSLQLLTPLGLMDIARYVCSRDLIIAEVMLCHSESRFVSSLSCC